MLISYSKKPEYKIADTVFVLDAIARHRAIRTLEQNANSPVTPDRAAAYVLALNHLLRFTWRAETCRAELERRKLSIG